MARFSGKRDKVARSTSFLCNKPMLKAANNLCPFKGARLDLRGPTSGPHRWEYFLWASQLGIFGSIFESVLSGGMRKKMHGPSFVFDP